MTDFERETLENWAYDVSEKPTFPDSHKKSENGNTNEFVFCFENLGFKSMKISIKKKTNYEYSVTVRENLE
ncbi:MAG: hypothetical protein U0L11_10725 [Acutalibacteraceae bacterium]|nr:hypothetical protein [Acutalibacteraceae bacterium]